MIQMYDPPPQGRVAHVERLLQVLAMLRTSERGVRRSTLKATVPEYAADLARIPSEEGQEQDKAVEALDKKLRLDLQALMDLGFGIDDLGASGAESRFVLRPTPWRLPLELEESEQAMLTWILRAPHATAALESGEPQTTPSFDALLGTLPGGLGLVHAALAGGRSLVIELHGEDKVVEPAQLACYHGRWFLLVRFPGSDKPYGYRLDRLQVVALGSPGQAPPVRVDPLEVLDPTAWRENRPEDVELHCDPSDADADAVASWFPRARRRVEPDRVVLRFSCSHREALLDRLIGLAGAARLVQPEEAVTQLRERLTAFVGTGA